MADTTPLAKYEELAEQFNITGDKRVGTDAALVWVRAQSGEMKAIANRLLVDLTTSHMHLNSAKDDTTKAAYVSKINTYENDLRQTSLSLDAVLALESELEDKLEAETREP